MTTTPDSLRSQMLREMHKTGCRLDDAAACADVAMRFIRSMRVELAHAYHGPSLSLRQISAKTGLSKSRVQQMLSSEASRLWTPSESTLPTAA